MPRCAINYILPYLTISYASGQWFLTEVWEKYHAALPAASRQGDGDGDPRSQHRLYQVMMDMRPGADPWVFFTQGRGGTWNNWDNYIFAWLGNLSQSIPVLMMLVLLPCALCMWRTKGWRRTRGYKRMLDGDGDADADAGH